MNNFDDEEEFKKSVKSITKLTTTFILFILFLMLAGLIFGFWIIIELLQHFGVI